MKILLDTDIGSDIDDNLALAYLLCKKDIEILGITTTSGEPQLRAQLARQVCITAKRDIPIHVGYEMPLSGELRQPTLTKAQTAVANSCPQKFSKDVTAIEFMRKTIEENPNEVTLVAIGPLTNVAVLFKEHPHIPALLGGMVIIGGRYFDNEYCDTKKWGETEWNIICDNDAAKIVFEAEVKNCTVIGVDQTCRFHISPAPMKRALYEIEPLRAVSDSINTVAKQIWFHDAIAIYAHLYPNEVKLQKGNIKVGAFKTSLDSETVFYPDDNGRHNLVLDFSPDLFIKNYTDTVGLSINDILYTEEI